MLKQLLSNIKDFILKYNTYFTSGYDDVYQYHDGIVANNNEVIFPSDGLGNYFYLRLPKNVSIIYDNKYLVSDCIPALGLNSTVILVAFVRNADADLLLQNLLSTLLQSGKPITYKSAIIKSEEVILQELALLSEENINKALQNLDNSYTLISITFTIELPFNALKLSCITNPCKSC